MGSADAREALREVRSLVWGIPAHRGQVFYSKYQYQDTLGHTFEESKDQLAGSVCVQKAESSIAVSRIRLPPGYERTGRLGERCALLEPQVTSALRFGPVVLYFLSLPYSLPLRTPSSLRQFLHFLPVNNTGYTHTNTDTHKTSA